MNYNTLFKAWALFCVLGVILYFPMKPRWNKIFSMWDAIFFYVGLAAPIMYIVLYKPASEMGLGFWAVVMGIVFGGGFFLYGMYRLILCWKRCHSVLQMILTPVCMLLMFGAFILGLLGAAMMFLGLTKNTRWFYWDDNGYLNEL